MHACLPCESSAHIYIYRYTYVYIYICIHIRGPFYLGHGTDKVLLASGSLEPKNL